MEIIIFGTGVWYRRYRTILSEKTKIVALVDNDSNKWGEMLDGHLIQSPETIKFYKYNKILILCRDSNPIRDQLMNYGIPAQNIWDIQKYKESEMQNYVTFYGKKKVSAKKNILIISPDLNYSGGTMAAIYATEALTDLGYNVVLAAPGVDSNLFEELMKKKITVAIAPALPCIKISNEENSWILGYDIVIVNGFQMIQCACEISRQKPVVWWIHEPSELYCPYINLFNKYANFEQLKKINIYAVSTVAKDNFNTYFPNRITNILPYGIPDQMNQNLKKNIKEKLVFAIIGGVVPLKAQDIFVKAINLLEETEIKKAEFLIIGYYNEKDSFFRKVKKLSLGKENIKFTGLLNRREIAEIFHDIDVVVCPSKQDSLPIVVTEGMMQGKVCIVSDKTGTIEFIEDAKNGFICKQGDEYDLAEKMMWVIKHTEKLSEIGYQARKVYEKNFLMKKFGLRLEKVILEAESKYKENSDVC